MPDAAAPPRWMEYQAVADLVPADRNAKDHDQAGLARSLEAFGFIEPVVVDERTGKLLGGHGRWELLLDSQEAGLDPPEGITVGADGRWQVPVLRGIRSRDDAHAEAMGIALNRVGEKGGWKPDVLAEMLDALPPDLFDAAGWGRVDLDDLLASTQEFDPIRFDPAAPQSPAGGEPSYAERGDNYRNKQVRSMVFDYPLDDYAAVADAATRARRALGIESNAELFQRLLADWTAANPA